MSIFGRLDAENVPSNPFFVEAGEYTAEVTDAKFKTNQKGNRQLLIDFTINNEESEFLDSKVSKFFDIVDESMTAEQLALLPPDEKKIVRRNMSALKNALCGNGRNKGLGIPVDDLNDENWNPAVLVGTKVDIAISNYGPNSDGVSVRWANIQE